MPGNFELLSRAAFSFQLFRGCPALRLDFTNEVIAAHEGKGVSIQIVEAGENPAPESCLRRVIEANTALAPLLEFGTDILGHQHDVPGAPDQLMLLRI